MQRNVPELNIIFANEVSRIAQYMWPQSEYDGAAVVIGREVDRISETDERIHVIEDTKSRRKAGNERAIY